MTWRRLLPWALLACFFGLWEGLVIALRIPTFLLPMPSVIVAKGIQVAGMIWSDTLVTLVEIGAGFGLGVLVGLPMAVAIAHSQLLEDAIYPLLVGAQVLPKIAVAPLLVVWFGLGLAPKVIIAFLIAFFPIVIDTVVGLKAVPVEMIYLARSMGGTSWPILWRIELPYAAPNIFAGLKVAATLAVVGAIVGEFVAADRGLGYMLLLANGRLDAPLLFAGILVLSVIGVVFFYLLEWLESRVINWHQRRRSMSHSTM